MVLARQNSKKRGAAEHRAKSIEYKTKSKESRVGRIAGYRLRVADFRCDKESVMIPLPFATKRKKKRKKEEKRAHVRAPSEKS